MKNFIRLHNSDDNGVIIVNTDTIVIVGTKRDGDRTMAKLILKNYANISPFSVNETPEMIIKPDDKDFIVLHDAEYNNVVICRKDNIAVVDTVKVMNGRLLKSRIYFDNECDMKPILVHESAEKIMQSLVPEVESK